MKRLVIIAFVFLLPSVFAEMTHSPKELSEGEEFTAWIDAEDDVKTITFYVCTLEDPYTCYKPETMDRNGSVNGRFEFSYKQSVGTQDTFLGLQDITPASSDCSHIIVKIHFPKSTMKDLNFDEERENSKHARFIPEY